MKNMRKIIAAITVVSTLLFAVACKKDKGEDNDNNSNVNNGSNDTNGGNNDTNGGNNDTNDTCTHTFGDWTVESEASCDESGVKTRECSICGYDEEAIIDTLDHSYVNGECENCGEICEHSFTDGECDDCGKICEHDFTDGECDDCGTPCDCTYGDWYGNTATCEDKGHEYRECSECGHVDSQETDALGHNYEERKCTRCGDTDYTLPPQPLG